MKLVPIFIFAFCLAIAVEAQTKTTQKTTTAKQNVASTTPKLTTIKTTLKTTPSKLNTTTPKTTITSKLTTLKPTVKTTTKTTPSKLNTTTPKTTITSKLTTLKPTVKTSLKTTPSKLITTTIKTATSKFTLKPTSWTTLKTTPILLNATTTTTTTSKLTTVMPSASTTIEMPVTTTAPTTKSFQICRDTNSTATSGSIKPLEGLTPEGTSTPRTCNFTIVAPADQKVQMSCTVANLTKIITTLDYYYFTTNFNSSSLIFGGTLDLNFFDVIIPNRVYTSYKNVMTATYRVVNESDVFDCKWSTIKAPTTMTDFKWCQDSETSAENGSIQTLPDSLNSLYQFIVQNGASITEMARICPFFINSSPNRQIQMSCSVDPYSSYFDLYSFTDIGFWSYRPKLNMTAASNGTRIELLSPQLTIDGSVPLNCNWTTLTTSNTKTIAESNQCLYVQSTDSKGGTITPLSNMTESNICLFSVIAPLDHRIQISCSVLNFSSYNPLRISGITELTRNPDFNRVYTSITNRIDVISSVRNADWFQCNWMTITIPPTTNFKLCRDGEATVDSGSIQPSSSTTVLEGNKNGGMCLFTIIAPFTKRVQIFCPVITTISNTAAHIVLFDINPNSYVPLPILIEPIANTTYTSTGNEMLLTAVDWGLNFYCTWTFI